VQLIAEPQNLAVSDGEREELARVQDKNLGTGSDFISVASVDPVGAKSAA
jgi:hypothetical protein